MLVCGGAGYIGSHMVSELINNNIETIVLDNLQKGHEKAVLSNKMYKGDLRDYQLLDKIFKENKIDSVIDFAADSIVGESVTDPIKYFENNIGGTLNLLKAMKDNEIKNIVFSSTAATYGEPESIPIMEKDKTNPTNPYGESKLAVEKILKWCENAYGIKYTALRYFNAAGAHIDGKIGEDHKPETHLIPLVIQAALGQRDNITIFGNDYSTPDGTCIRDYIHVTDLASAHLLALKKLQNGGKSGIYNLGNGKGFSVKEVIDTVRKITGKTIKEVMSDRRAGDPAVLVASSEKAVTELQWQPKFATLEKIIETAWNWHSKNPKGYSI